MRVLHVITMLDTGGAEHLVIDLLPQLKVRGVDVEILLFNGAITPFRELIENQGIKVFDLNRGPVDDYTWYVYNPFLILKLAKYLRDYDIIHTHNTACQFYVPLARLITGSRAKLVTTEHSSNNRRRSKWWFRPIDKWMYNQYDAVVSIADKPRKNLEQYIGSKNNFYTIANGVDIKRFWGPINDISGKKSFLITMVAGLRNEKDHETLFRAMTHLPDHYRLCIVGNGVKEQLLKEKCQQLAISDRVDFLGARMDIPDILKKSDVIVLSSHWEGLSLSSIEGMASGRPFIASDVDGLREVVGGAGVLFPHGDDVALAQSIKTLCDNPAQYRQVASACQERAKNYDISVMADRYYWLYKSLM